MDEKQILIDAITKGLAYQENGGKLDLDNLQQGASGEMKSIFQFTPSTWKLYAKQVLGDEKAPLTNDNETEVVRRKVAKWIDEGKTTSQIASMWNAGEKRPDAYKQNWKGVNKYGVAYDTPTYAKNVLDYSKKFFEEKKQQAIKENNAQPSQPIAMNKLPLMGSQPEVHRNQNTSPANMQGLLQALAKPKI